MFTLHWNQILHLLSWHKASPRQVLAHVDDGVLVEQDPEEDRPRGCGWFDSSHDLQQGLQVREADNRILALLPLSDWLALQVTPCYQADTSLDTGTGMIADPTLH